MFVEIDGAQVELVTLHVQEVANRFPERLQEYLQLLNARYGAPAGEFQRAPGVMEVLAVVAYGGAMLSEPRSFPPP
jgi:hypothetical protein